MRKESDFQHSVILEVQDRFPGCIVLKNDANYIQGIPDLLVLYKNKWAALECKRSIAELKKPRPNQEYYVSLMHKMSFASFIYPENRKEVLDALESTFRT